MPFRVSKSFLVESGHMLSKHPSLCRFPHGHSRRIEVVLVGDRLDQNDMLCDFKAIKLAMQGFVKQFDHSLAINSVDPLLPQLQSVKERVVVFENQDPTTEVMAKRVFDFLTAAVGSGMPYLDDEGNEYRFPSGLKVERVRVTETSSTWAEYSE